MTTPMTTNPGGVEEIVEFRGGKGPYGGDPYFRGPLMGPLPQYNYPPIKSRIYVTQTSAPTQEPITTMPQLIQPTPINLYIIVAIIISIAILVLLLRK